jgi:hypothetical protein
VPLLLWTPLLCLLSIALPPDHGENREDKRGRTSTKFKPLAKETGEVQRHSIATKDIGRLQIISRLSNDYEEVAFADDLGRSFVS